GGLEEDRPRAAEGIDHATWRPTERLFGDAQARVSDVGLERGALLIGARIGAVRERGAGEAHAERDVGADDVDVDPDRGITEVGPAAIALEEGGADRT